MYFNPHNYNAKLGHVRLEIRTLQALHIVIVLLQLASGVASNAVPTFTLSNKITVPLVGLGSASDGVRYQHVGS
jgi:hypothetical protein